MGKQHLKTNIVYNYINILNMIHIVTITNKWHINEQFSVPQIGGSSKRGSHVYFLLIVAMVVLLWCQIVLLWHQVTMVASDQHLYQIIVLPRKLATWSIHDYHCFATAPLVGILFMVLRITRPRSAHGYFWPVHNNGLQDWVHNTV